MAGMSLLLSLSLCVSSLPLRRHDEIVSFNGNASALAVSRDAKVVAVGHATGFSVWPRTLEGGWGAEVPKTCGGKVISLSMTGDGTRLAVAVESDEIKVRVWDIKDEGLDVQPGPPVELGGESDCRVVATSRDGNSLAVGCGARLRVYRWDPSFFYGGEAPFANFYWVETVPLDSTVTALAWADPPSGSSGDEVETVLGVVTEGEVRALGFLRSTVTPNNITLELTHTEGAAVGVSHSGGVVACATAGGVQVWNISGWTIQDQWTVAHPPAEDIAVAFTPSGDLAAGRVVNGSSNTTYKQHVQMWRFDNGHLAEREALFLPDVESNRAVFVASGGTADRDVLVAAAGGEVHAFIPVTPTLTSTLSESDTGTSSLSGSETIELPTGTATRTLAKTRTETGTPTDGPTTTTTLTTTSSPT
eukprot:Hpha_TRINITY_DN5858_c0_g1::TRINITY_DN5858_c0_g1_i1::g.45577::m.45577